MGHLAKLQNIVLHYIFACMAAPTMGTIVPSESYGVIMNHSEIKKFPQQVSE